VKLPPRPLGWVAGALALVLIATVVQHGGDPSQATVIASALVELLLLWSFALQGIVQLLRARATFRIPIDLALTIDGYPTRSIDGSPAGLAARVEGSHPALGASVALTVDLDDGRSLATHARVRHREPTRDGHATIVGLELLLPNEQEGVWAAQLARTAVGAGQRTTAVPARPLAPTGTNRWLRAAQTLSVGAVTIALVAVTSVLALPAFGLRSAVVVSASMSPALHTGDLVIVRQIPARQLEVGDIARIDLVGDGGTTHRVVAISARTGQLLVTTRGDANTATEQWDLDPDLTVGRVQLHIPWVGRIASRVGTAVPRNAVTVAVVVLAAVVVASALRSRRATAG
jgi:signal peptidase